VRFIVTIIITKEKKKLTKKEVIKIKSPQKKIKEKKLF